MLPKDKPRYVMGVGYPEDLLVSVALGADMFDCVWPTRTARFGNAITPNGVLNLRHSSYARDYGPIDATCTCPCCSPEGIDGGLGVTRSYIYHTANKETVGAHLLSMHNVHFLLNLMAQARTAIIEDRYPIFLRNWLGTYFDIDRKGAQAWPSWVLDALKLVHLDLMAMDGLRPT